MTDAPPRTDDLATLVEATDLLNVELPDRRWADEAHLRWLYRENPFGHAVIGYRRDGERLDAHYGLIPQQYRGPEGPVPMMFSLNAVTRSVAQRQGHFWSIGEEVYARAREEYGAEGIIGVSNDNSTPPVVKKLGWRLMGPLPVRIIPRAGRLARGVTHLHLTPEVLAGHDVESLLEGLDHRVDWGYRNRYTPTYLRWRLGPPNVEPYWLHLTDELWMLSTRSNVGPLPAAVILKVLPRREVTTPLDATSMVRSVAAHHGAPFAVYAGFNARVHLSGLAPPRRLQPAPLNLIFRPLPGAVPATEFRLDTYEFLDMDAY